MIEQSFVGHGDSVNEIRTQPLKPSLVLSASKVCTLWIPLFPSPARKNIFDPLYWKKNICTVARCMWSINQFCKYFTWHSVIITSVTG